MSDRNWISRIPGFLSGVIPKAIAMLQLVEESLRGDSLEIGKRVKSGEERSRRKNRKSKDSEAGKQVAELHPPSIFHG